MNLIEENISKTKSKHDKKIKSKSRSRSSSENDINYDNYLDNNLTLEKELKDKPEILTFISRLQELIKKQAKKIKKLKSNLKHFKKKNKTEDVKPKENIEVIKEPKSIVEEITEAAEKAVEQTGFVYEATSGMYYDFNSGYYYNAELGLYYDGNRGTYLTYNDVTKKYVFHSQVEVVSTKPLEREIKLKRKKQQKEQEKRAKIKKRNSSDENLEEGECSSSDNEINIKNGKQTESESDIISDDQEIAVTQSWPPCMRIIVKETSLEKIKIGSLYIVTCDGGTIGREGNVSILIPDINVSKTHAEIKFDEELNSYQILDLGSQNGTILNGKRISEAKQKSKPFEVVHGSLIQFGTTKLLCHIHDGQKTCGHCEPGLIQIDSSIKPDKDEKLFNKSTQYKKELRRLKKKFGLEAQENTDLAPGYSDRAEERRKVVGSSTDKEKTQAASLEQSIAKENKGFKMLAKMGWSEGQSLGKDGTGLTEPVPIISNPGKTGLGSSPTFCLPLDATTKAERKSTVWKKTQQRYQLVQEVNLQAFKESSSDEEGKT